MTRAALALAALLVFAARADAATYYVDISCGSSGTGTADTCGGSTGYINSAAGLQTLLSSTVTAGDIVLIRNGTYATTNVGGDPRTNGGFTIGASGTAGNPITVMNYPGHSPLLTNCPIATSTYCNRPTITTPNRQYVVVKSNTTGTLVIKGGIWIFGISETSGSGSQGMEFSGLEIYEGWGQVDDGNWAAFFIDGQDGAWFHHNYIHDILVPSGGGSQSSGVGIKLYYNSDVIVEYNTIDDVNISGTQTGGIDDKAWGLRNIFRYNWIQDVNNCLRLNSQSLAHAVTDDQFYGNVCIGRSDTIRPGVRTSGGDGTGSDDPIGAHTIRSNTFYRFSAALWNDDNTDGDLQWYNNIFHSGGIGTENVIYNRAGFATVTDYNAWISDSWSYNGSNYSNLTAWQASGLGFDAHSHDTACSFTSAPTDMTLSGGTCTTGGRVAGAIGGATIQQGAYGVTDCVGHTCTDEEPEPPAASGPRRFRMKVKP